MKKETAIKRTFKKIEKNYPLLRKGLRAYFVEIIILTYENFQNDEGFDYMTDSKKLDYSYEINTCDEYHSIINDYDKSINQRTYEMKWTTYALRNNIL